MVDLGNCLFLGRAAPLAGVRQHTLSLERRRLRHGALVPVVTERVFVIILELVVAAGAFMERIALLRAGLADDGNIPIAGLTSYEFELTEADLEQLTTAGGLVICGAFFTITSVGLK